MSEFGIPAGDGPARDYFNDYATIVAADPAKYGLSTADSAAITAAAQAYSSCYTLATSAPTRTELTIIAKDEARNACEALIRLYSIQIKYNAGISTEDKAALRIAQPNTSRTSRNVSETLPLLSIIGVLQGSQTLRFSDSTTPDSRAKPFGAQMLELRVNIAETAGGEAEEARPCGIYSKNPIGVAFNPADNKKVATYWGRWANTKGQFGPWSLPVSMTIAA
jgi:hypothetical protein